MCGNMADIHSATAEIRRGKKKKEEETTGQNIMVCFISIGDHKKALLSINHTNIDIYRRC